jgi:hypothetical protein
MTTDPKAPSLREALELAAGILQDMIQRGQIVVGITGTNAYYIGEGVMPKIAAALATPPAPTPSAARAIQPFERYPAIAAEVSRMASTGVVGSLIDWQNFIDALNSALLPDAAAIRAAAFEPTDAQINSACLSFRHDYGLLDDHDRERLRFVAIEWLRAWQKEGFGCDRDEVIERCAAVVDQCNREGPYEAIASAKRIRALKSAAIRAAGEK